MSVSMKPTWTATTCVCCDNSSRRSELVSDHDAAFAAQYRALGGAANQDSTDSTFTIAPPPLSASTGANDAAHRQRADDVGVDLALQLVQRVVGQHRGSGPDAGVVDQQRDVPAALHRGLDVCPLT